VAIARVAEDRLREDLGSCPISGGNDLAGDIWVVVIQTIPLRFRQKIRCHSLSLNPWTIGLLTVGV